MKQYSWDAWSSNVDMSRTLVWTLVGQFFSKWQIYSLIQYSWDAWTSNFEMSRTLVCLFLTVATQWTKWTRHGCSINLHWSHCTTITSRDSTVDKHDLQILICLDHLFVCLFIFLFVCVFFNCGDTLNKMNKIWIFR